LRQTYQFRGARSVINEVPLVLINMYCTMKTRSGSHTAVLLPKYFLWVHVMCRDFLCTYCPSSYPTNKNQTAWSLWHEIAISLQQKLLTKHITYCSTELSPVCVCRVLSKVTIAFLHVHSRKNLFHKEKWANYLPNIHSNTKQIMKWHFTEDYCFLRTNTSYYVCSHAHLN
jgi:hypothetical protein